MPAKKLQQIMKSVKDEIEQQVDPVVEELQSRLNEPYFLGYMEHKLKYDPGWSAVRIKRETHSVNFFSVIVAIV